MQFPVISMDLSLRLMKSMKSGSPVDPCPAKVLSAIAEVINPTVNRILNNSLQEGHMPPCWKHAKILPLLKKKLR